MSNKVKAIRMFIGLVIFAYACVVLLTVVRGLTEQLSGFLLYKEMGILSSWFQQIFPLEWYIWIGDWTMALFHVICVIRCIKASLKIYDAHYVIKTGIIGLTGKIISVIASSIYYEAIHLHPIHIIPNLIIVLIGFSIKYVSIYEPFLVFIKQRIIVRFFCRMRRQDDHGRGDNM